MPAARPGLLGASDEEPLGARAIRAAHTVQVARLLREHGGATAAQLGEWTRLTRPTLAAILQDLVGSGIARRAGSSMRTAAGRPGRLYAIEPRHVAVAVARVGPGDVEVELLDAAGAVVDVECAPHPGGLVAVRAAVGERARALQGRSGAPLGALAVLVPGRIPPPDDAADAPGPFGWSAAALRAGLRSDLGVPVVLVNPAAAAAAGEALATPASAPVDLLLVFLDHGIGAGLVDRGVLAHGGYGAPGEFGHSTVPGVDRRCVCGKVGCLETVAAGWAIRRRIEAVTGEPVADGTGLAELEAVADADAGVQRVLHEAAETLGWATSWLINALDPQVVRLGGSPFAVGAPRFLRVFEDAARDNAALTNRRFSVAAAHPRADFRGAAQLALEALPPVSRPNRSLTG